MINYKILDEEGVVIVEPSGPLQKSDFENLSRDVDAHIEKRGEVNGLIIHARSFPGWENFGAFTSHMSFVKDHHKKIRRIAMVSDSKFFSIAPVLAKHFVSAEVKHFDYEDLDAARQWVSETASAEVKSS